MKTLVSLSNKLHDLKTLKPDTVLTLYHGSTFQVIVNMCLNGIDGKQAQTRKYPHYVTKASGRVSIDRGLFCSHDLRIAKTFGPVCVKFKTLAKNIVHIFPEKSVVKNARSFASPMYPKSFKPEVSFNFLNDKEKQGLFIGVVRPDQIERVYVFESKWLSMTPQEFLSNYQGSASPSDLTMRDFHDASVESIVRAMQSQYPGLDRDLIIQDIVFTVSHAQSLHDQIEALTRYAPYSVAKKICFDLRKRGLIDKLPSKAV